MFLEAIKKSIKLFIVFMQKNWITRTLIKYITQQLIQLLVIGFYVAYKSTNYSQKYSTFMILARHLLEILGTS